jgi:FkbH-like protein
VAQLIKCSILAASGPASLFARKFLISYNELAWRGSQGGRHESYFRAAVLPVSLCIKPLRLDRATPAPGAGVWKSETLQHPMKLIEALKILNGCPAKDAPPLSVGLVCGFTPLHLQTFLAAHLQLQFPDRKIQVHGGLYGDFVGNLERVEKSADHAVAVVIEWQDLDPRLGIRSLGGWTPGDLADVLRSTETQLRRVRGAVERILAAGTPSLVVSLPTLPLPPLAITPGWQASAFELDLRARMASFGLWAAEKANVKVTSAQMLDRASTANERFDIRSEVLSGFPYKVGHAAAVASLLAKLMRDRVPKKGLITDLDDTLWSGILGEVGVEGISWDMEHHAHLHGLYQQLLRALAEEGVLIAAASKNDAVLVEEAFRRAGMILSAERIFPFEIHWRRKSESIANILRAWNITADSVVFVDDSAMEIADVNCSYPEIECLQFPKDNYEAAYELLHTLRDLFGKGALREEDAIRLETIRRAATVPPFVSEDSSESANTFLEQAEAQLTLSLIKDPPDPRALELVNKTNQFNLNGRRFTEAGWRDYLKIPNTFLMIAAYRDKYGPLGKIAVIAGRQQPEIVQVDVWVMSCRAFSRRIEYCCLEQLFREFNAREITLDFSTTPKNGPLREFLGMFLDGCLAPMARISRDLFLQKCPPLFQEIKGIARG